MSQTAPITAPRNPPGKPLQATSPPLFADLQAKTWTRRDLDIPFLELLSNSLFHWASRPSDCQEPGVH